MAPWFDSQTTIAVHAIIVSSLIPSVLTVRAGRAVLWGSHGRFVKAPVAFVVYIGWAVFFATVLQTVIQNFISSLILPVVPENLNVVNAGLLIIEFLGFQALLLGEK